MAILCNKCGKYRKLKDFPKDKRRRSGYINTCKICVLQTSAIWRANNPDKTKARYLRLKSKTPWIRTFHIIGQRCNNPNHEKYKYYGGNGIQRKITSLELKNLYIRDNANELEYPSIDRIDSTKDYTFENCQYIEFDENRGLTHVL